MNKKLFSLLLLVAAFLSFAAMPEIAPAPRLYPELTKYFISVRKNTIRRNEREVLGILKGAVVMASMDDKDRKRGSGNFHICKGY
ncbi:hypothetical protein [Chitinophaga rhizophila]|uniref:Uncharacterized protein n=1 Tax=Chitinophaga rhizophila TaxID=2866212 RepID=A0ABS7G7X8_9BACT|nr:hypothetical protein [Chitinophaga rhizophila]MBW8682832.1 hypothetical protein [Chitinophaga rhizophila]